MFYLKVSFKKDSHVFDNIVLFRKNISVSFKAVLKDLMKCQGLKETIFLACTLQMTKEFRKQ